MMRGTLKSQERVDGRYGRLVCGPNANLGAAGTIAGLVGDLYAARRHDRCSRDCLSVHLERLGKVAASKRRRDVAHVLSNRADPSGVRGIVCVKDDAPTIPKVLENVRRRVLIHAHDRLTACLHRRECTVRMAPGGFALAPARAEWDQEGEGGDLHRVPSCHG
ncbi:MAG: hypothetical protein E6K55_16715 [Gemmatimonadetes bacterium]|nr:MAG: hypothetical protein E6K55_16715 [Gemmatimonadota bacterium]